MADGRVGKARYRSNHIERTGNLCRNEDFAEKEILIMEYVGVS